MTSDGKRKTLTFLLLAMIAMVMIAVTMPHLTLEAGVPFPRYKDAPKALPVEDMPVASSSNPLYFEVVLGVIVVAVLVWGGYHLLKEATWKKIPWPPLVLVIVSLVVLCVLFAQLNITITSSPFEAEASPPVVKEGPPLGTIPTSLIWLVWVGLLGVAVLTGVWAIRRSARQTHAADPVKLEAEQAMRALEMGLGLKNVIVRCYQQMSLALQREQGIELEEAMTAREFERLLTTRGIPYAPVHQLTRLFEGARYSLRPVTPTDEQQAFECLSAIVHHSNNRD